MTVSANAPALDALRKRLAGKDPPRVVAGIGPESWLREETVRVVAAAVLGSAGSPNLVTVRVDDGAEGGAAAALERFFDEARTTSLFGDAKVVALREADEAAAADPAAFLAWLRNPSRDVTVVIVAEELKADLVTAAGAAGVVVNCGGRGSRNEDPPRFVARRAAARGQRIGADEAAELVHLVGDDMNALENAIEVLSLHADEGAEITQAAIRSLFPGAAIGDAEEFAVRLLDGDLAGALAASSRCFDQGVPEAWGSSRIARDERSVAFTLAREFGRGLQRALDARRQIDAGVPRNEIRIGTLPPFLATRSVRIAAARRPGALESMAAIFEDTDRGMKSGGAIGRVAIVRMATAVGRVR